MNVTLDYLRSRKIWLIKNLCVWGKFSTTEFLFIHTEIGIGFKRIIFNRIDFGNRGQEVNFNDLYDFKGNKLPQSINLPKVIVLPKNESFCTVTEETSTGFKIARGNGAVENGLVDLLILELG